MARFQPSLARTIGHSFDFFGQCLGTSKDVVDAFLFTVGIHSVRLVVQHAILRRRNK